LNELWETLGFGELRRVFRKTRHRIDVEALMRVMVFNRLCDPESKLGVLRWMETVAMPGIEVESITQRLSAADSELSPERAIAHLQRIQHHRIRINLAAQSVAGISRLSKNHDRLFAALKLKNPTQPLQLPLLWCTFFNHG